MMEMREKELAVALIKSIREKRKMLIQLANEPFPRVASPHAIYQHPTTNKLLLDVYQVHGHSETGGLPGWRTLDLAKVETAFVLKERFRVRGEFKADSPRYEKAILLVATSVKRMRKAVVA